LSWTELSLLEFLAVLHVYLLCICIIRATQAWKATKAKRGQRVGKFEGGNLRGKRGWDPPASDHRNAFGWTADWTELKLNERRVLCSPRRHTYTHSYPHSHPQQNQPLPPLLLATCNFVMCTAAKDLQGYTIYIHTLDICTQQNKIRMLIFLDCHPASAHRSFLLVFV